MTEKIEWEVVEIPVTVANYRLGNSVARRRKLFGWTQSDLAVRVGVSVNTISAIETGVFYPTARLAAVMCHHLCCVFDDLFWLDRKVVLRDD